MHGRFHQLAMKLRQDGQRGVFGALVLIVSLVPRLGGQPGRVLLPQATPSPAIRPSTESRQAPGMPPALSPREREVATLMARGHSNREIAHELYISIATVERHASNIYNKLGLRSRTQVAVWAVERGLALPQTS